LQQNFVIFLCNLFGLYFWTGYIPCLYVQPNEISLVTYIL